MQVNCTPRFLFWRASCWGLITKVRAWGVEGSFQNSCLIAAERRIKDESTNSDLASFKFVYWGAC